MAIHNISRGVDYDHLSSIVHVAQKLVCLQKQTDTDK